MPITYMNSAAAIKAFCGERGGLVCTSSNARTPSSGPLRAASAFSSCPTSIWAATPAMPWAFRWTRWRSGIRGRLAGRPDPERLRRQPHPALEGPLLGPPALPARATSIRSAPSIPASRSSCIPSAAGRSARRPTPWVDRAAHRAVEKAPEGTMFAVGTEIHLVNRMAQRFAAQASGHHARRHRLPLHHHVPHQPATPGLGPGESGRRPRGQPHPGPPRA